MNPEADDRLLIHALQIFRDIEADPIAHGAASAAVVARARAALRDRHPDGAESLVVALRAQAWFEQARLDLRRAKGLLDEACRLARRHRLPGRLAEVLLTRAAVHLELGQPAACRRDIAAAAPDGPAGLDLQQASLLYNAGYLDAAATLCRRVFQDPGAGPELRTKVANNLAIIEVQRGRAEAALPLLDEAARLAAEVGPFPVAVVASSRAWALAHAGRLGESMAGFDRAEALYRRAGLPTGELLMEQLDVLADLRLLPEARELADRAVADLRRTDAALRTAEALFRAARLAMLSGDDAAGHHGAVEVADLFRRQRRPGWTARAETLAAHTATRSGSLTSARLAAVARAAGVLERLGLRAPAVDAHLVAGTAALASARRRAGLAHLDAALPLSRRGSVLVRLRGRLAAALAAQARADDREVLRESRAGLSDLTRHRAALGSMELRALASGHGAELGALGLAAALRAGGPAEVLGWMERTRAAALLTVAPPAEPEVRAALAALLAVQAELDGERSAGREPDALIARQAGLEAEVRRASWRHAPADEAAGRPASLAQLRRLLEGRTLACFGTDGGAGFAVLVDARRARLVPVGASREIQAEADAVLFALRRLTRPGRPASLTAVRDAAEHGLRRLQALLLAPLGLDPATPLVVVPDDAARSVPWSALHPAPVSVAPSATVWARAAAAAAPDETATLLVAGPDLPGAVDEVRALAGVDPRATVLAPPQSTVEAVTAALARVTTAHLACHGLLRHDNPTFSALRLAGGDLSLQALDLIGAAPRRVVLAACDSATGTGYDGGEVLGFVGALLARGAGAVVASAAPVGDIEAVDLMTLLHRGLVAGLPVADALHAARGSLDAADPRAFVNRCAFTAFGAG